MIELIGNGRPAGDLLSRLVRITLGGTEYALPVQTIGGNRSWRTELDGRLSSLLDGLQSGGDDVTAILGLLNRQVDDLLDLLVSYDTTSVLPEREVLENTVYEDELLLAVREVWRAANPLVGMTLDALVTTPAPQENGSSAPTSTPPPSTAGRPRRSRKT